MAISKKRVREEEEQEVAQILLEMPQIIFESEKRLKYECRLLHHCRLRSWSVKRRRSDAIPATFENHGNGTTLKSLHGTVSDVKLLKKVVVANKSQYCVAAGGGGGFASASKILPLSPTMPPLSSCSDHDSSSHHQETRISSPSLVIHGVRTTLKSLHGTESDGKLSKKVVVIHGVRTTLKSLHGTESDGKLLKKLVVANKSHYIGGDCDCTFASKTRPLSCSPEKRKREERLEVSLNHIGASSSENPPLPSSVNESTKKGEERSEVSLSHIGASSSENPPLPSPVNESTKKREERSEVLLHHIGSSSSETPPVPSSVNESTKVNLNPLEQNSPKIWKREDLLGTLSLVSRKREALANGMADAVRYCKRVREFALQLEKEELASSLVSQQKEVVAKGMEDGLLFYEQVRALDLKLEEEELELKRYLEQETSI